MTFDTWLQGYLTALHNKQKEVYDIPADSVLINYRLIAEAAWQAGYEQGCKDTVLNIGQVNRLYNV